MSKCAAEARPFRPWVALAGFCFLLAVLPGSLTAQTGSPNPADGVATPLGDLIGRARSALIALRFDEALASARAALALRRARPAQLRTIHQLMAAAFYPDPTDAPARQQPDSAVHYLRLSIEVQPDAELADDLRWRGLDSLYAEVRARTFAAQAYPPATMALTGFEGRGYVDVVTSRPAGIRLLARDRLTASTILHDSVASATRARLALRAHDGTTPLFQTGEYDLLIEVTDLPTRERRLLSFSVVATGLPPMLESPPSLEPSRLQPERTAPVLARGLTTGILFGAATVAIATYARAQEPIRSAFPRDARAMPVAVGIVIGGFAGGFLDRGQPIPEHIAENRALRAQHAQQVTLTEIANRRKAASYKVELQIAQEAR